MHSNLVVKIYDRKAKQLKQQDVGHVAQVANFAAMQVDTRPYQPSDLPRLQQIYLDARTIAFTWESSALYKLEDFDQATEDEVIWVATVGNRPIGYISWWSPENFIHHLFVDPHFTHRGAGKALLQRCLSRMGRPASLKCLQCNVQAIAFYQSQGWQITAAGRSTEGMYYTMILDGNR